MTFRAPHSTRSPLSSDRSRAPGQTAATAPRAIERGFEGLWSDVRQKPAAKEAPGWDQSFLSLFYTDRSGSYRKGMPLWFANGTDASTGKVITTPIAASDRRDSDAPWPFRGARDFHTLMGGDVSIATGINNTARFPYLEPEHNPGFGD